MNVISFNAKAARRRRTRRAASVFLFLVALAAVPSTTAVAVPSSIDGSNRSWTVGEEGLGTFETCDRCDQCLLDAVPEGFEAPTQPRNAEGIVHCKKCLGCNVVLSRLGNKTRSFTLKRDVNVNTGASGAAILKGFTADHGDVFVKVWCGLKGRFKQSWKRDAVPETCKNDGEELEEEAKKSCPAQGGILGWSECNFRFLNALNKLAEEANLTAVTPRSWTSRLRSFLPAEPHQPSGSVKVDGVRGQMFEAAEGLALGEILGGGVGLTQDSWDLMRRVSHRSVVQAATWDLLFSESDRHAENVFITESAVGGESRLTLIDNEGAFDDHKGISTVLIPGSHIFEVFRVGHEAVCCARWEREGTCPGRAQQAKGVQPEVLFDFRCHTPGRFVGTALPPGVEPFLRKVDAMSEAEVVELYGMSHPSHAATLKRRARDILEGGFEFALLRSFRRQPCSFCDMKAFRGDGYAWTLEKPCCGLRREPGRCRTRAAEGKPNSGSVWDLPEGDARAIWPGNSPGTQAERLYPITILAPAR